MKRLAAIVLLSSAAATAIGCEEPPPNTNDAMRARGLAAYAKCLYVKVREERIWHRIRETERQQRKEHFAAWREKERFERVMKQRIGEQMAAAMIEAIKETDSPSVPGKYTGVEGEINPIEEEVIHNAVRKMTRHLSANSTSYKCASAGGVWVEDSRTSGECRTRGRYKGYWVEEFLERHRAERRASCWIQDIDRGTPRKDWPHCPEERLRALLSGQKATLGGEEQMDYIETQKQALRRTLRRLRGEQTEFGRCIYQHLSGCEEDDPRICMQACG